MAGNYITANAAVEPKLFKLASLHVQYIWYMYDMLAWDTYPVSLFVLPLYIIDIFLDFFFHSINSLISGYWGVFSQRLFGHYWRYKVLYIPTSVVLRFVALSYYRVESKSVKSGVLLRNSRYLPPLEMGQHLTRLQKPGKPLVNICSKTKGDLSCLGKVVSAVWYSTSK